MSENQPLDVEFRIARRRLRALWDATVCVVDVAKMIDLHRRANKPFDGFSPEMTEQRDDLISHREECRESFKSQSIIDLFEEAAAPSPFRILGHFAFRSVLLVADMVSNIGWRPCHRPDPAASRLLDEQMWYPFPCLGNRDVVVAFENALTREDAQAERLMRAAMVDRR